MAEFSSADLSDAIERNFNGISPEAMRRLLAMAQTEARRIFGSRFTLPPPRHVIDVLQGVVRDLRLVGERDVNTTAFRSDGARSKVELKMGPDLCLAVVRLLCALWTKVRHVL